MKKRKLLSLILCFAMIISNGILVFADDSNSETTTEISVADSVYAEFPVQIDKFVSLDGELDLIFYYYGYNEAQFTIKDNDTNEVVISEVFTGYNDSCYFTSVPMDKEYTLTVTDAENTYTGILNTKYKKASFPEINDGVSTYSLERNNDNVVSSSNVLVRKVGDDITGNDAVPTMRTMTIDSEEIDPFTSLDEMETLEDGELYNVQTTVEEDGHLNTYSAFMTSEDESYIFEPGYTFSFVNTGFEYNASIDNLFPSVEHDTLGLVFEYQYFKNAFVSLDAVEIEEGEEPHITFKFVPPEDGTYVIETIGNADTTFIKYTVDENDDITGSRVINGGGVGNNARETMETFAGTVRYYEIQCEDDIDSFTFRITFSDGNDTAPNFLDVAYENYMEDDIYTEANTIIDYEGIGYKGDVDVYLFEGTSAGYHYIEYQSASQTSTVVGNGFSNNLEFRVYRSYDNDPYDESSFALVGSGYTNGTNPCHLKTSSIPSSTHYYLMVIPKVIKDGYFDYEFETYTPIRKDEYEPNDWYDDVTTVLNPLSASGTSVRATLSKNDYNDMYSVTSGETGGTLTATLEPTENEGTLYDLKLFTATLDGSDWEETLLATAVTVEGKNVITYNMPANTTYYLEVSNYDMGTSYYSSYAKYTLKAEYAANSPTYTATLSGNVTLTHTSGTDITNLDDFKNAVMNSLTCYSNGTEVSDTIAIEDIELFYNDTELTASMVNSLEAGNYIITVKYNGVEATGGIVTLSISSQPVEVDRVYIVPHTSIELIDMVEYDWVYCAKLMADRRLIREGSTVSSLSIVDGYSLIYTDYDPDSDDPTRGTLANTLKATKYFYTNGTSSSVTGFSRTTNANLITEDSLYNYVDSGCFTILQMADSTDTTNVTKMRYLVVCGVDKTNHKIICADFIKGEIVEIDTDKIFNGGYYTENNNIKFLGAIRES